MDGLNKLFKENPMEFMLTRALSTQSSAQLNGAIDDPNFFHLLRQGHYDFDISGPHHDGEYRLNQFAHRGEAGTWKSNRLHAYWLPWHSAREEQMVLGRDADLFFTSALDGCRVQIGAGETPTVMHIPGLMTPAQRQTSANQLGAGSRRFSISHEYPDSDMAFLVGKATTETFTRRRRWRFYAQGIRGNPATGRLEVTALRAMAPNVFVVEV